MVTTIIVLMEESVYTYFEIRVSACEFGVARESKPERDTYEMMLNVEKDLAMHKAGRKTF